MAVGVDCLCLRRMRGKAKGRSWGEGLGDALASLSRRISAIAGPGVGCSLTGVARDALSAAGLGLRLAQNSQPGRRTTALPVSSPRTDTPGWGGAQSCIFGYSPIQA